VVVGGGGGGSGRGCCACALLCPTVEVLIFMDLGLDVVSLEAVFMS